MTTTDTRLGVAAFDFDGTITTRDTLLGFMFAAGGPPRAARALLRTGPALAAGFNNSAKRDLAKECTLGLVFKGRSMAEIEQAGHEYAGSLTRLFRPATLERIAWHKSQEHRLVIVSASLVYYLRPIAESLGFESVIGVELAADSTGRATGQLARPNVRCEEKATRLRAWLEEKAIESPRIWAYGDSSGDEHLLQMADHPTWVGKRSSRNP